MAPFLSCLFRSITGGVLSMKQVKTTMYYNHQLKEVRMFKDMKLATKITLGFGALIVVALVLGIAGWMSVKGMSDNFARTDAGNECLNVLNQTGSLRREFAIYGFDVQKGETKNAAEKWAASYDNFNKKLSHLGTLKGLKMVYRDKAMQAQKSGERYKDAFEQQKESRTSKDDAFSEWGKIGWEVTDYFEHLDNQNIGTLRQDFVEPFLLLRVTAVYLLATDGEEQWESFSNQIIKVKDGLEEWRRGAAQMNETAEIYAKLSSYIERYGQAGDQYWDAVKKKEKADQLMAAEASHILGDITSIREGLEKDMKSMAAQTTGMVIIITIIAIIIGGALSFFITRSIVRPINAVIDSLSSGSEQVASASEQLSSSSQQMSEGASEQASSLEEVSSSLEEMSSMTKQNTGNSRQATSMAGEASGSVSQGKERMGRMSDVINRIKVSSDETAKIVKTIDEIAMQTNLLALNAAVEAARAGEAGRGFAVVAEEVRNLAQRSADAAKNTANLIAESQKNAEDGVESSKDVNDILEDITEKVKKVDQLIAEVSAASDEQSQGIDQINTAIAQMDTVTQQNAANSEESASASEELSSQAQQLNSMVGELTRIVQGSSIITHSSSRISDHSNSGGSLSPAKRKRGFQALHSSRDSGSLQFHAKKNGNLNKNDGNGHRPATAQAKEVRPQEAIPFDEDIDLKEF
ncbi:MAG: hypothetical protein GF401_14115 [Chitinivibrionales bacterium]|nr:hypothetical protein [Chitinivibrionales bacterium]